MVTTVWVTFRFEGFHYWQDAPAAHLYLSKAHRHEFHVRAEKKVNHDNRDVEFIELKRIMSDWAREQFGATHEIDATNFSCEQMATKLLEHFDLLSCSVSEDGENGASVYKE